MSLIKTCSVKDEYMRWDAVHPGQCLFIETHNSVYHLTRRTDDPAHMRFKGDGGEYMTSTQPVAPIGSVCAHMLRWQVVEVGYPVMLVRCIDGMRMVTSPVVRIELHKGDHGSYQAKTASRRITWDEEGGLRGHR